MALWAAHPPRDGLHDRGAGDNLHWNGGAAQARREIEKERPQHQTAADPEKPRKERRHQPRDRGYRLVGHPHLYKGVMRFALAVVVLAQAACGPGDGAPERTFHFGSSASPSASGTAGAPSS